MAYQLELDNIVKTFPGVMALKNMSLQLKTGEILAICGENGAGKSTLMKIASGVHKPDSGEIRILGKTVQFENPMDSLTAGIATIYQETSLFEEMTVLENLFLSHEMQKKAFGFFPVLDYAAMSKKASNIFEMLQVNIDLDSQIKSLGMAQKQMVEIAKALTYDSKILVFDEPTASLTQKEVDSLFAVIRKLKDEGVSIIYISHRLDEIFELCDRVTVIRDGSYISTKDTQETSEAELVSDMVGREVSCYVVRNACSYGEPILEVKDMALSEADKGNDFSLMEHQIIGFAGLAGSGRTELAEALCGLRHMARGEVYIDGKLTNIANYNDAKANGITYVSEDRGKYGLVLDMSVAENISLPQIEKFSEMGFIVHDKEVQLADEYIDKLEIKAPSVDFLTKNLSGGNQQKVALAKALALNPKVLILDEPTRGVDVGAKAEIHSLISEIIKNPIGIIVISSELPELLCLCDQIFVMAEGEIKAQFNKREATQESILTVALNQH